LRTAGFYALAVEAALLFAAVGALQAQNAADPADTLERARLKINATMRRMPKYACLQTINREYYTQVVGGAAEMHACVQSNSDLPAVLRKSAATLRLDFTDRVRLEVAQGDTREIHSWPGASRFESGYIDELIQRGPAASGSFGGYLVDIFGQDGVEFNYLTEKFEGSHHVFIYAYRVPREISYYRLRTHGSWATTAFSGTVEIDNATLDLLHLTIVTPALAPETGLCTAESSLEYAGVHIGDGDFLLPRQNQLRLTYRDARVTNSTSVFSGCREWHADSALRFDDAADAAADGAAASGAKAETGLPARIPFTLRLATTIDSDTAAAGDAVSATVTRPVKAPKSNLILIPAGAVARGRISRMEHHLVPGKTFVIGIAWQSLEVEGVSMPLAALLDRNAEVAAPVMPGTALARRPDTLTSPDALVIPSSAAKYVLPPGFESHWVTVKPPAPATNGDAAGK
jgi:hypothetical protein